MRSSLQTACFAALAAVLLGLAVAHGQTPPPATDKDLAWQVPHTERTAAPDVYLLPDSSGKLRQVLGFQYEDFLRAWNNRDAAAAGPPRYAIEEFSATGAAGESLIRLQIEIRIASHVDGWLDVPLELADLVIERVELGEHTEGECVIYDTPRGGHVAWLAGHAGQERTIEITGTAKISTSAGKSVLEIAAPHATRSLVKLTVPTTDVHFEASPGLEVATTAVGEQAEVTLRGSAHPLRVEWRRRLDTVGPQTTTLESTGELTVKVDRRRASYTARLQLNSFDNPLELVRVRLPQGARMTQYQTPPELQAVVSESQDAAGNIVEVRLNRSTNSPWTLELSAEQPLGENDATGLCQIGGLEVLGAVRQSGLLTLEVDEELQAYFDLSKDLEQVPLVKTDEQAPHRTALAAFEYAKFPWTLTVHTQPKQRRVTIEPRYHLQLNPDDARLEIEFDYQFAGARTFAVRVDLRGWQLTDDPLESGGAIEASRVVETQQGLLVLPLVNPDAQRARVALAVRKPLELGEQIFTLPEALGGFLLPGQLVVESDPSLQMAVDAGSLEGLGVLTAAEQETSSNENRQAFRTFLSRASLGATVALRPRQVAVEAHSSVRVGQTQLGVRQELKYLVKYRPLAQVELSIPRTLPEQRSFKVLVDGKEIAATSSITESAEAQATRRQLVIALPQPVQGAFRLELAYEIPYAGATPDSPAQVALPLAAPVDPLLKHEVVIEAQQPRRVALGQAPEAEAWNAPALDIESAATTNIWRFTSTRPESTLPLLVQMDSLEDLQNAILERAWLQSWVVGASQQDRSVFQFRTPHANVQVELPKAVVGLPLEVLLDGEPVDFEPPFEGRLSVSLPHVSPSVRHVLEVRYQRPANLVSGTALRTALPKLVCRPMSAPVYWQLVLPRGWQVAQAPAGMTSESWLGWKAYRWGRQPTRSQSDLEQWTAASSSPPPSPTTNQYLYSAFEVPAAIEVVVARQIWLVLATTLAAFGLGMLCANTSIASKFSFWLGLALALMALVFVYPELTLLAGQAILWGGVMTLAVVVLRRAFLGRPGGEIAVSQASSLSGSTSATESWTRQQRITSDAEDEPTVAARVEGSKF